MVLVKYVYDVLGCLIQIQDGVIGMLIESYVYDVIGNWIVLIILVGIVSYIYFVISYCLIVVDGEVCNYDVVGNMISIGSKMFIYSDVNCMNVVK